jgi:hypothetical protein
MEYLSIIEKIILADFDGLMTVIQSTSLNSSYGVLKANGNKMRILK